MGGILCALSRCRRLIPPLTTVDPSRPSRATDVLSAVRLSHPLLEVGRHRCSAPTDVVCPDEEQLPDTLRRCRARSRGATSDWLRHRAREFGRAAWPVAALEPEEAAEVIRGAVPRRAMSAADQHRMFDGLRCETVHEWATPPFRPSSRLTGASAEGLSG